MANPAILGLINAWPAPGASPVLDRMGTAGRVSPCAAAAAPGINPPAEAWPDCIGRPEIMLPSPGVVPTVDVMESRCSVMRNQDWHVAILPSAIRGTSAEASG